MLLRLLTLAALAATAAAVLPPGYEDELWCPRGTCKARRPHQSGFAGPASAFYDCRPEGSSASNVVVKPTGWGFRLPAEDRERLISEHYTQDDCGDPCRRCVGRGEVWLEGECAPAGTKECPAASSAAGACCAPGGDHDAAKAADRCCGEQ